MSENEILKAYAEGINSIISLVKNLSDKIDILTEENKKLNERVKVLENQRNTNSNNSSKPPSSDGFKKKTKSLRKPSGKKPGGQEGHDGTTLYLNENPDEIKIHTIDECSECGSSLKDIPTERYIIRQVIDIPEVKVKVTEHRSEVKKCTVCGHENIAKFPKEVVNTTQYGENTKAVSVYLTQYQLIPYRRMKEFFKDIFNLSISEGSLVSFNENCHKKLEPIEENIKTELTNSTGAVHFDETGTYVEKNRKWLHVACNNEYTYYKVHDKRGKKATDDIDILTKFKGTAVHDCWKTYHEYTGCSHSLCCAHILRELNGITELEEQNWAEEMKKLLLAIKKEVDIACDNSNALSLDKILEYENKYNEIVKAGVEEDYTKNRELYSASRKKSKSLNLLNRLILHNEEILRFMNDFDIPFDNNQAERDIRMTKVKQKISGTFRSTTGADAFTRIRGYVSTVRKQGKSVLDCIRSVFTENPVDPTLV